MANHETLSGKGQLYRRTIKTWHCFASIDGVQHRSSTKEEDLALACKPSPISVLTWLS